MQDFAGEDLLRSGVLALSCVDQICVNTVVYVFFHILSCMLIWDRLSLFVEMILDELSRFEDRFVREF